MRAWSAGGVIGTFFDTFFPLCTFLSKLCGPAPRSLRSASSRPWRPSRGLYPRCRYRVPASGVGTRGDPRGDDAHYASPPRWRSRRRHPPRHLTTTSRGGCSRVRTSTRAASTRASRSGRPPATAPGRRRPSAPSSTSTRSRRSPVTTASRRTRSGYATASSSAEVNPRSNTPRTSPRGT